MFGRGRGHVAIGEQALLEARRWGPVRRFIPTLPYQEAPRKERYEVDGNHLLNSDDHRTTIRILTLILSARNATAENPLWEREIVDTMIQLNVPVDVRIEVMERANRIPAALAGNMLIFKRTDASNEIFFHRELTAGVPFASFGRNLPQ